MAEERRFPGAGVARWLTVPLCAWSERGRWAAVVVAVLVGVGWTLVQVKLPTVFHSSDSSHYLQIARGQTDLVEQPFASRQLGPRVAAWLGEVLRGGVERGFLVQGFLSLIVAMGVTCWLAVRTRAPRWLLLAMMLVPSWAVLVQYLVLPDLWYAALVAVLLVLLEKEMLLAAAVWMLPMMLSRESTSLTLVCFLVAAWPRLKAAGRVWAVAGTAVVAAVVGSVGVGRLAAGSRPNVEHLPQAVYMLAKIPWNFLRNVVGVLPWSDANTELCTVPVWRVPFRFGPVHELGVCGVSVGQQLLAVEGTLVTFGLLPLMVAVVWWRLRIVRRTERANAGLSTALRFGRDDKSKGEGFGRDDKSKGEGFGRDDKQLRREEEQNTLTGRSVMLRFALLYGGVSFLLAPVLGAGFVHLMQYAWPLFLVALPGLVDALGERELTGRQAWASVGVGALSVGVPMIEWCRYFLPRLGMGVAVWVVGYWLLRVWLQREPEVTDSAPVSRRF